MKRLLSLIFLLGTAAAGCGSSKDGKAAEGAVAATVNGQDISVEDVKKVAGNYLRRGIPPDVSAAGQTREEKLYYTAVDRLIEQSLVLKEAERRGLQVTEEEISSGVDQLVSMGGGQENFDKLLADQGATMADVERDVRTNLLFRAFYEAVSKPAPEITEEDVKSFYDGHREQFGPQSQVHARHILVEVKEGSSDFDRAEARKRIEDILARVKQGEAFDKLAQEHSADTGSGQKGGDLGWFGPGQMVAAFDSAAFALAPKGLSGIVETPFGYHIIKVEESRTTEGIPLADVRERIRDSLVQEKAQTRFRESLGELRAKAKLDIHPPTPAFLDSLRT